jgi:hypothetical protein
MNVVGNLGPVQLLNESQYEFKQGTTRSMKFRGTQQDLEALRYMLTGYTGSLMRSSVVQQDGPFFELHADFAGVDLNGIPTDDQAMNQWYMVGNDLELELWKLPKVKAKLDAMTSIQVAALKQQFTDGLAAGTPPESLTIDPPENQTFFREMFTEMQKGVISFPHSQIVLRNVRVVWDNFDLYPYFFRDCGKLVRTETLISALETALPEMYRNAMLPEFYTRFTYAFIFPYIYKTAIRQLAAKDLASGEGEGVWLIRTPTLDPFDEHRYTLTAEWWYAQDYSHFIYGDPL